MTLDLPKHWKEFLVAVDRAIKQPVTLHCVGGFVVEAVYGIPRRTGDLDYVDVVPPEAGINLEEAAGLESDLARTYQLYLQRVGIADLPEDYESRLKELKVGLKKLKLRVFDPYDLILSKLTRNLERDREDVKAIAKSQQLNFRIVKQRYEKEMRPWLPNVEQHDLTLKLWEEFFDLEDPEG